MCFTQYQLEVEGSLPRCLILMPGMLVPGDRMGGQCRGLGASVPYYSTWASFYLGYSAYCHEWVPRASVPGEHDIFMT